MIVVASERAARAAAFGGQVAISIDRWLRELADALAPGVTEATWLEEILAAAEVIRARGGNPSIELARGVVALLRRCDDADVAPERIAGGELAAELARTLAAKQKRARGAAARLLASALQEQPLFARGLAWPARITLRDLVRLTPARLRLFRELARVTRLEVDLALALRPLGGSDALGRIGDLYAEVLDGPPSFRAFTEEQLAPCIHHAEPDLDAALTRAMGLLAGSLDSGFAPDACALAWPHVPADSGLRALGHAARAAKVPVLAERRASSARSVNELLRWCELLAGELRFEELLALLRSPLLELDVDGAELQHAIARLTMAPPRRGLARVVLAEVAEAEVGQPGAVVTRTLATLAATLGDAGTMHESAAAIGEALAVLGLARGASRGGTDVFRADAWPDPAERALLASIAGEERALATFETLRSALVATTPRGVGDLARDIRQLLEAEAPRMAGNPGSVRTGSLGVLATEHVVHVVIADGSYEAWASRREETVPALIAAERLAALAAEAELLLLRLGAERIDVITSSSDARGEPQRLHPMFVGAPAAAPERLVLTEAEVLARAAQPDVVRERIRRQRAREAWRGDESLDAELVTGRLPNGLPRLASAERPLSPHAAEQFVACPYRGFVAQELRARAESDPESMADPSEEGRILHELLEKAFLAAKPELDRPEPDPDRVRALGEAAALENATRRLVGIRKVQVRRLLSWVTRALDEASRDRAWRFEGAEIEFGHGKRWPAVEVDGTWYAGRLDRLDRSRATDALRVVDYKRSSVTAKLKLQLPIYAIAAERNDPRHGHAEYGVYLVPRRAGGSAGLKEVRFEQSATEQVRQSIVPTLARLRAGDVAPRPHSPSECRTCDARGVCRRPPFRVPELP